MSSSVVPPCTLSVSKGKRIQAHKYRTSSVLPQPHSPMRILKSCRSRRRVLLNHLDVQFHIPLHRASKECLIPTDNMQHILCVLSSGHHKPEKVRTSRKKAKTNSFAQRSSFAAQHRETTIACARRSPTSSTPHHLGVSVDGRPDQEP